MIVILDCGSNKVPCIEDTVDQFIDFKTIPFLEFHPDQFPEAKGVIISGAPLLITEIDMEKYLIASTWIKNYDKPLLGICFGHQIIGLQYGAFGSKIKEDRDWQEIEQMETDSLFSRIPTVFQMMEDHCEVISIPAGFTLLASSDASINEGMRHKDKNVFGVQFHPEVSGNMGSVLIENFIKICENPSKQHDDVEI
ncbi:gamma-glutamyl-gamma-aminobutyrate hydrolase family protein [Crocinitomicaceae bacterium]|jgi:GMP synthase (glutamine-hydrolysing)|nr:gamma-glutamyl-gamma-aminobutyrate hydrolase family protein [Crocinitomicaceae bacterium]